jgi:glucose/mannose-6-phosphate isomerase
MGQQTNINLDDLQIYRQLDPENVLEHLHAFPALCRQAWEAGLACKLPQSYSQIGKIVILGMGGSAIGGDLVNSLAASEALIPIIICRDYALPRYVDANTLVIASSYSGMTEETLSAFQQALVTPAKKLVITTGGTLKILAEEHRIPVITFDYPAQPRAALPFSFFIILAILHNLGILKIKPAEVKATFSNLKILAGKIRETVPSANNPAKLLAHKLYERLPVIYGGGITAEVARRWKTQINENSKVMSFYEVLPELNHNAVVGYKLPAEITRQTTVVMLDSDFLPERVRLRYRITGQLLEQAGIDYQVINGVGAGALSQMLYLVLLGDYVSYYLAMLNNVDPSPVKAIDFLKKNLASC